MDEELIRKVVREEIAAANKEAAESTTTLQEVVQFFDSLKKLGRK